MVKKNSTGMDRFKVGILMACHWPVHTKLANLLVDQFNKGPQGIYYQRIYSLTSVEENDVKAKVRSIIEKKEVDILLTIGRICTVAAKKTADEMGGFPLYFMAVRDPEGEGIMQPFKNPGTNDISGVNFEEASTDDLIDGIKAFYPEIKNLFLPYLSTSKSQSLIRQALEIEARLTAIGMKIFTLPIDSNSDKLIATIKKYNNKIQGIISLDGCSSSFIQKEISFLSWDKCLVSIGSNALSIDEGFCVSHSGKLDELAAVAYRQLRLHAEIGMPLNQMPITILKDNREFNVNIDALRRIGFSEEALLRICSNHKIKVVRKWTSKPISKK